VSSAVKRAAKIVVLQQNVDLDQPIAVLVFYAALLTDSEFRFHSDITSL